MEQRIITIFYLIDEYLKVMEIKKRCQGKGFKQ